jgi:hypothetical protein
VNELRHIEFMVLPPNKQLQQTVQTVSRRGAAELQR